MVNKNSSPKKPTAKAATRSRSTTSSTTARKPRAKSAVGTTSDSPPPLPASIEGEEPSPGSTLDGDPTRAAPLLPAAKSARRLNAAQQDAYLHGLTRGASPAAACLQIGVSVLDVLATIERDEAFNERLGQVNVLLSQNVVAALYRSAMEGSVSAQTFFLKNQPPPSWQQPEETDANEDPLNRMNDDELIAFCRASGIDWPTENATDSDSAASAD